MPIIAWLEPSDCPIVGQLTANQTIVRLYVRLFTFIIVSSTFSVYTGRHAANKWFYFFRLHKRGDQPMARMGRVRTLSYALNNWRARSTLTYHPKLWHSSRRKAVGTSTEYNVIWCQECIFGIHPGWYVPLYYVYTGCIFCLKGKYSLCFHIHLTQTHPCP